ncbi:hypothetical protein K432DRAFT_256707, partial [Lepidopterella palustris CBS 459.81]
YEQQGKLQHLQMSIQMTEFAIQSTPQDDPPCFKKLSMLCFSLFARYKALDAIEDLDQIIERAGEALRTHSSATESQEELLDRLCVALYHRYLRKRETKDLEYAITKMKEAMALHAKISDKPLQDCSLCDLLRCRFLLSGDIKDLENAVSLARNVVAHTTMDDPNRPIRIQILSSMLLSLYHASG